MSCSKYSTITFESNATDYWERLGHEDFNVRHGWTDEELYYIQYLQQVYKRTYRPRNSLLLNWKDTVNFPRATGNMPPLTFTEPQKPFESGPAKSYSLSDRVNQPDFKEPTKFMPLSIIGMGRPHEYETYVRSESSSSANVFEVFGYEHLSPSSSSCDSELDMSSDVSSSSSDEESCEYFVPLTVVDSI
jgi:hypothetical protein